MEELPNELYLIIFSYLNKSQLIESFYQLNQRYDRLLLKYFSHIYLSSILKRKDLNYLLKISSWIQSLTIENKQIGKEFLEKCQIKTIDRIKLIDQGMNISDDILSKYQPNILNIVMTSFNQCNKSYRINSNSIKQLQMEFYHPEYAKKFLTNEICQTIPVYLHIIFPKLSDYFQLFQSTLSIYIQKLSISIFSIDQFDLISSRIILPNLDDFQIEICFIPFISLQNLLPINFPKNSLRRFAFIGQTNTINAKSWRSLLSQYQTIEQFHLHLSNVEIIHYSDLNLWNEQFPGYKFDYIQLKQIFRIHSSKFDRLERIILNESIEKLNHLDYFNEINHLIIRSEYWCSYLNISYDIQKNFMNYFQFIQHLTTTYRQLEILLLIQKNFLNQILQLDLEFSEKYCFIHHDIAKELIQLKSLSLSSFYDGIHDLHLHSTIKDLLLIKFPQIIYLYIDAIRIIDDEQVENTISQWYLNEINQPMIDYQQGKSLSIWF